jgi:type I restriction enzyme, S subunit
MACGDSRHHDRRIAETALLTFPACFPDSVVGFTADEGKADARFIEYLFRAMRERVRRRAYGSVQENINLEVLRGLEFPVPPFRLQREIADCLSWFDDRIALLRETNATLEAIAQALFKSWFVDFDPVRAKSQGLAPAGMDEATAALFPDGFEESALGFVPRGWTIRPLDQIATYLNGLALQKYPPQDDAWLPVIKIAQLRKGDTAGADRAGRNIKPEYVVVNGDVLFSWSGSLEVEVWCGGEGALNQHLFKVTSGEFPKWFYFWWTRFHLERFRQIAASKATTMGHIQRGHLSDAKVLIPPRELLDHMSSYLAPLLDRVVQNELQAQALVKLRDTLLPRLISGQLRLPEADAVAEGAV